MKLSEENKKEFSEIIEKTIVGCLAEMCDAVSAIALDRMERILNDFLEQEAWVGVAQKPTVEDLRRLLPDMTKTVLLQVLSRTGSVAGDVYGEQVDAARERVQGMRARNN